MLLRCCQGSSEADRKAGGEWGTFVLHVGGQPLTPETQDVGLREQPGHIWVPVALLL